MRVSRTAPWVCEDDICMKKKKKKRREGKADFQNPREYFDVARPNLAASGPLAYRASWLGTLDQWTASKGSRFEPPQQSSSRAQRVCALLCQTASGRDAATDVQWIVDVQPANSTYCVLKPPTSLPTYRVPVTTETPPNQCHPLWDASSPRRKNDHVFGGPTRRDPSFLCRHRH